MITDKHKLQQKIRDILEYANEHLRDRQGFRQYVKDHLLSLVHKGEILEFKVRFADPIKPDPHIRFQAEIWYGKKRTMLSFQCFTHVKD